MMHKCYAKFYIEESFMNYTKNHKVNGCQSQERQCTVWYELQRNRSFSWMEDEDVIEIGKN